MDDLALSLREPLLLTLLGILVLLWFLLKSGRKLLFVRMTTIGLLVLLIAEPMASYVTKESKRPFLPVLVDVSRSMVMPDSDTVSDSLRRVVAEIASMLEDDFRVELKQFWNRVEPYDEDVTWDHEGSALGDVLEAVEKEEDPAGIVMLTDGASNMGKHPLWVAKYTDVPVFVVGAGSPPAQGDLSVRRVMRNSIVYAEDEVPLEVWIRAEGYGGERTRVALMEGEEIIETREIEFTHETEERTVEFKIVPKREGTRLYDVKITPLEGEVSVDNNQKRFGIRVLKKRSKILYLSSSPSWEHKFLRMTVETDPNMELHSRIPLNGKVFSDEIDTPSFTKESLAAYDCYVVHNIAARDLPPGFSRSVADLVADLGKSLLFIAGEESSGYEESQIGQMLPVILGDETIKRQFEVEFTADGLNHPVVKAAWENQELPPLTGCRRVTGVKPGAVVWAVNPSAKTARGPMAVMTESLYGEGRVVAITCFPLWRWHFLPKGLGKEPAFYTQFVAGLTRWLSTRRDIGRLVIELGQPAYETFEEIEFSAELYDDNYRPIDGAFMKVDLDGGGELTLRPVGNGRYVGVTGNLLANSYEFTARAYVEGAEYATKKGLLEVTEGSIESTDFGLQEELLKKLAVLTGGEYYTLEDLNGLSKLEFPGSEMTTHRTLEFIYWPVVYLVLLGMLVAEWAAGRLKGRRLE